MPPNPTIHSFFKPLHPLTPNSTLSHPGDGFTPTDLSPPDPLHTPFAPNRTYTQHAIGSLVAGSRPVRFQGRIANSRVTYGRSKRVGAAAGWVGMVVCDGTGGIYVKLYFSSHPPPLHITQFITVYTPNLVRASSLTSPPTTPSPTPSPLHPSILLGTSIFPGRDAAAHLIPQPPSSSTTLYRTPLDSSPGHPQTLMTLSSFLGGGDEVPAAKLLLALTAIHPSRKLQSRTRDDHTSPSKQAEKTELVVTDLTLEDHTGTCKLTLFSAPPPAFTLGTILLLTAPTLKRVHPPSLSLGLGSLIDADPDIVDVTSFRVWADRERKLHTKSQRVREEVLEEFESTVDEAGLHTLVEMEERVRAGDEGSWTAWLSLVVGRVEFVRSLRRGMVGVGECCGIPLYSTRPVLSCPTCNTPQSLSINPSALGLLIDETGTLEAEKLLWTPMAWRELLSEAGVELILREEEGEEGERLEGVKELQERIGGLRFSFLVGWEKGVERLCVLGVRM